MDNLFNENTRHQILSKLAFSLTPIGKLTHHPLLPHKTIYLVLFITVNPLISSLLPPFFTKIQLCSYIPLNILEKKRWLHTIRVCHNLKVVIDFAANLSHPECSRGLHSGFWALNLNWKKEWQEWPRILKKDV
jgi:hypothetical protein